MCVYILDVQQEKQHNELIQSVEGFNTDVLRKTETIEKSVLPNAEGNSILPVDEQNALNSKLLDRKNITQLNRDTYRLDWLNNGNELFEIL